MAGVGTGSASLLKQVCDPQQRKATQKAVRRGFPGGTSGEQPACQGRKHKRGRFNPWVGKIPSLEEEMATCSSILAWRIPLTEELVGYSP